MGRAAVPSLSASATCALTRLDRYMTRSASCVLSCKSCSKSSFLMYGTAAHVSARYLPTLMSPFCFPFCTPVTATRAVCRGTVCTNSMTNGVKNSIALEDFCLTHHNIINILVCFTECALKSGNGRLQVLCFAGELFCDLILKELNCNPQAIRSQTQP